MKKIIAASSVALALLGGLAATYSNTAHAAPKLSLIVDGQPALANLEPFESAGILYVPARTLLEYYPAELKWDNLRKKLMITTSYSVTTLSPGSSSMQIQYTQTEGGYEEKLEAPVLLKAGHNYVPADTLPLLTGAEVELDASGRRVTVVSGSLSTSVRVPEEPLAVASTNSSVKLYAALKDGDTYKGFILEVNGKKHSFDWKAPRDTTRPPELYYADIDSDGKPEATVVLYMGHGTGMMAQEVHVVKPEQWKELDVPPAEEAAAAAVSSVISLDRKDVLLKLELAGSSPSKVTMRLPDRAEDGGLKYFGDKAGIGAVTYYRVENGRLKAETNVTVGMLESMGTLMLDYKAGKGGMVLDTITFEAHDTLMEFVEQQEPPLQKKESI
ncbi:hypothetical protein C2I18_17495 [Paenibacillus sp. PK3_47]|uniref:stalk domain-containing protein n=1 Tax=Paenibacillus sp. PK3_47 TaxID=2072642 RepID=UPI00201E1A69|nr:stalk domain-containing protein [Paenibacillus sp. PK3_47]UQZ35161.1 hypothetical protein C2I18_17495 [Paenibacillus sp. PK3_47]